MEDTCFLLLLVGKRITDPYNIDSSQLAFWSLVIIWDVILLLLSFSAMTELMVHWFFASNLVRTGSSVTIFPVFLRLCPNINLQSTTWNMRCQSHFYMWRVPRNCVTKTDIFWVLKAYIFIFLNPLQICAPCAEILLFINHKILICGSKDRISARGFHWYFNLIMG